MSASLWNIHQALQDLEELRAQVLEDGDTEAAAAVDQQIAEWLERSPEKVRSYIDLIRSKESKMAAAKSQEAYYRTIRKAEEADVERLYGNALAVMQRYNIKTLEAMPGGGFRRQGNGGLQPLDIPEWPKDADGNFKPQKEPVLGCAVPTRSIVTWVPDTEKIREALKQRVVCPRCNGTDVVRPAADPCPHCKGELTIPSSISGARLLPRGENVQIFPKAGKEIE